MKLLDWLMEPMSEIVAKKNTPQWELDGCDKPQRRYRNDEAQIAVILIFFIAVVFIGFYFIVLSGMMQEVSLVHYNMTVTNGMNVSQDRQDSLMFLQSTFGAMPVIAFVITILSAVVLAVAAKYQVL